MNSSAASVAYWILPLVLGAIDPHRAGHGGPVRAEGGQALLAPQRGARYGGAGDEMADPGRRRGHARSAAWPGVVMNGSVLGNAIVIGIAAAVVLTALAALGIRRLRDRGRAGDAARVRGLARAGF